MKPIPHDFVLENLQGIEVRTKPMFGCTGVYVGDKIIFILRDRGDIDDGVWLATTDEHHATLKKEFPSMRSIALFAKRGPTGWQVLPVDRDDFEETVLRACELVRQSDPRLGKVPKARSIRSEKSQSETKKKNVKKSSLNLGPAKSDKSSRRKIGKAQEKKNGRSNNRKTSKKARRKASTK